MQGTQSTFWSFLPILFVSLIWGVVGIWLTRQKGKTRWYHYISCFIPGWSGFYIFWLLTLTNIDIVKRIDSIDERLKQVLGQRKIFDPAPTKWKCQCGQLNDTEVTNCPVCGLKRDFLLEKAKMK
jgi:hypothetical protein